MYVVVYDVLGISILSSYIQGMWIAYFANRSLDCLETIAKKFKYTIFMILFTFISFPLFSR